MSTAGIAGLQAWVLVSLAHQCVANVNYDYNGFSSDLNRAAGIDPGGRAHFAMGSGMFDDSYVYVYGGMDEDDNFLASLWRFNDSHAEELHDSGNNCLLPADDNPPALAGVAGWVMDGEFYIFGGKDSIGRVYNIVWKWQKDGGWVRVVGEDWDKPSTTTAPGGRSGHSIVFDEYSQKAYIVAGVGCDSNGCPFANYVYLNDVWTFHATQNWTHLSGSLVEDFTSQPPAANPFNFGAANHFASRHSAMAWVVEEHLYFYGGQTIDGYLSDMWAINIDNGEAALIHGNSVRNVSGTPIMPGSIAAAYPTLDARQNLVFFGGVNSYGLQHATWVFDLNGNQRWTWYKIAEPASSWASYGPNPRPGASFGGRSLYQYAQGRTVMFGGVGRDDSPAIGFLSTRFYVLATPEFDPPCDTSADCDNYFFCDGQEVCDVQRRSCRDGDYPCNSEDPGIFCNIDGAFCALEEPGCASPSALLFAGDVYVGNNSGAGVYAVQNTLTHCDDLLNDPALYAPADWVTVRGSGRVVTIDTCGPFTEFANRIMVYRTCALSSCFDFLAAAVDANLSSAVIPPSCPLGTRVSFFAQDGRDYHVSIDSTDPANATGTYAMRVIPPFPECAVTPVLELGTFTASTYALEVGVPGCNMADEKDGAWYTLTGDGQTWVIDACDGTTTEVSVFSAVAGCTSKEWSCLVTSTELSNCQLAVPTLPHEQYLIAIRDVAPVVNITVYSEDKPVCGGTYTSAVGAIQSDTLANVQSGFPLGRMRTCVWTIAPEGAFNLISLKFDGIIPGSLIAASVNDGKNKNDLLEVFEDYLGGNTLLFHRDGPMADDTVVSFAKSLVVVLSLGEALPKGSGFSLQYEALASVTDCSLFTTTRTCVQSEDCGFCQRGFSSQECVFSSDGSAASGGCNNPGENWYFGVQCDQITDCAACVSNPACAMCFSGENGGICGRAASTSCEDRVDQITGMCPDPCPSGCNEAMSQGKCMCTSDECQCVCATAFTGVACESPVPNVWLLIGESTSERTHFSYLPGGHTDGTNDIPTGGGGEDGDGNGVPASKGNSLLVIGDAEHSFAWIFGGMPNAYDTCVFNLVLVAELSSDRSSVETLLGAPVAPIGRMYSANAVVENGVQPRILLHGGAYACYCESRAEYQAGYCWKFATAREEVLGDTWLFVFPSQWIQVATANVGPGPRWKHCMERIGSDMLMFGGADVVGTPMNDLWSFNINTFEWEIITSSVLTPPASIFPACASDDLRLFVYGGTADEITANLPELWKYEAGQWSALTVPAEGGPPGLFAASLVHFQGLLTLFGGFVGPDTYHGDLFTYVVEHDKWIANIENDLPKPSSKAQLSAGLLTRTPTIVFLGGMQQEQLNPPTNPPQLSTTIWSYHLSQVILSSDVSAASPAGGTAVTLTGVFWEDALECGLAAEYGTQPVPVEYASGEGSYIEPATWMCTMPSHPAGKTSLRLTTGYPAAVLSSASEVDITFGDCPSGTSKAASFVNGDQACPACPPGQASDAVGATVCVPCQAGKYTNKDTGFVSCANCPVGTFAAIASAASCTGCPPGEYQALEGQSSCARCGFTSYSPARNLSACVDCLEFQRTVDSGSVNETACRCIEGYYGGGGLDPCTACPVGGVCPFDTALPTAARGYWGDGYGATVFSKCPNDDACLGGETSACKEGYEGRLCGDCQPGYYKLSGLCEPCPGGVVVKMVFAALGAFLLCGGLIFAARQGDDATGVATPSIALSFFQVTSVFEGFSLKWPDIILRIFGWMSFTTFNLELMSPECAMTVSYGEQWAFSMCLPLIIAATFAVLWVGWAVFKYVKLNYKANQEGLEDVDAKEMLHLKTQLKQLGTYTLAGYLLFLSLGYMFVAQLSLEVFGCTEKEDGTRSLNAYPSMICGSEEHQSLVPGAIIGIIFYVIGIPALFVGLLTYFKYKGDYELVRTHALTGWMCNKYDEDYFYWDVTLMARKFIILVVVIFLTGSNIVQVLVALAMLFVSLLLQVFARPFEALREDMLEFVLLISQFCILFTGILRLTDEVHTDKEGVDELAIVVIVLVVISTVAITVVLILESRDKASWLYNKITADRKQQQYESGKEDDVELVDEVIAVDQESLSEECEFDDDDFAFEPQGNLKNSRGDRRLMSAGTTVTTGRVSLRDNESETNSMKTTSEDPAPPGAINAGM